METEPAWKEAQELGEMLMNAQQQEDHTDSVDRAWNYVTGWVAGNKGKFESQSFKPMETYGIIEKNRASVICRVLNQALEDAGYSSRKCIKGFAERGYIISDAKAKAINRTQEVKRINGVSTRVYVLNMEVKEEEWKDDGFLS